MPFDQKKIICTLNVHYLILRDANALVVHSRTTFKRETERYFFFLPFCFALLIIENSPDNGILRIWYEKCYRTSSVCYKQRAAYRRIYGNYWFALFLVRFQVKQIVDHIKQKALFFIFLLITCSTCIEFADFSVTLTNLIQESFLSSGFTLS